MVNLVKREQWKARPPKGNYDAMPSGVKGCKIHYTGGHVNPDLLANHLLCAIAVKGIQNGHMDGNGWLDIGYSFVVCPHRYTFVGRGLHKIPAANGAGLNSGHYAILGLVGNSGLTVPTDGMLNGIVDTIEYVRKEGKTGKEVKGHRDGYATDCPGKALYAWVQKGAKRPDSKEVDIVAQLPLVDKDTKSFDVKTVRACLFARGYLPEKLPQVELWPWLEDVEFSSEKYPLDALVKRFQKDKKLDPDGVVGALTWAKLLKL